MTAENKKPKGVVGVLIAPNGHVWCNAADFERQGPAGFTLPEAQRSRVRRRLALALVKEAMSPIVAQGFDTYDAERLRDNLLQKGWKEQLIEVGHEETNPND